MTIQIKAYLIDKEWLKLSNKALRAMPASPRQREIQAKMREIEQRYGDALVDAPKYMK